MFGNSKGSFIGIFIFIIFTLITVLVSVIFMFIGDTAESKLKETLGHEEGVNETITNTFGNVNVAYDALPWITTFIIVGQILGIMIGSYLVTTKPVFFIPYIFLVIIAIIASIGISNAYEVLISNPTLADSFSEFTASSIILLNLPMIVTIIGFIGGIIMFSQLGRGLKYNG